MSGSLHNTYTLTRYGLPFRKRTRQFWPYFNRFRLMCHSATHRQLSDAVCRFGNTAAETFHTTHNNVSGQLPERRSPIGEMGMKT
jgi:hypothetical protein